MKIALITDLHFGARSDSPVFDKFFEKFYTQCFFPYLDEHGINTVVDLGDTFEKRKTINFQTLSSCKTYFFDTLAEKSIQLHALIGNHDTALKNTNDINSVDLVLREYDNIKTYKKLEVVNFDGLDILMLPWICSDNYDQSMDALKTTKAEVVFGHLEIAGFQMYRGNVNEHGLSRDIFDRFDIVLSGHFHHRSTSGNITYLGNPYEITWADYQDQRGFHVLDTDTRELTFIKNPYTIYEKFNYDEDSLPNDLSMFEEKCIKIVVVNKVDQKLFDKFIAAVNKLNPIDLKIIEDYSEFESDLVDDDSIDMENTMSLLSSYVDSSDITADKTKIKNVLKSLYIEATQLENI